MRDPVSRRRFLQGSAAGLGGLLIAGCAGRPASSDSAEVMREVSPSPADAAGGAQRLNHIGLQLYTVRGFVERDMAGTLREIATIGYREVEFAGYFGRRPSDIRAMLDQSKLSAPSAHVGLEELRKNTEGAIAAAEVMGHRFLIVPWLQPPATLDAWHRIADEFNRIGAALQARAIQFAYHNHDFEFRPIAGTMPYDLLLAECDPELVKMEMDLFWTVKGGGEPLSYFERFPGRFPLVHVKDMRDPGGAEEMTEVGSGQIGFREIFASSGKAGLVHYVVEHDNPADPLASIRTSYHNLHEMLATPSSLDRDRTSSHR